MLCESGTMVVLKPGAKPEIATRHGARVMLLGGAPLDGARHLWWNFVASSPERIEQAKADWKEGRSEEHTSELQSLMRISYAVFCLQKKKMYNCQDIINHNR